MKLSFLRATPSCVALLGRSLVFAALLGASHGVSAQAQGDPAAAGRKKQMCEGCHGIPDYRTAYPEVYTVPKLGGQSAAYMVKALQAYKSGARKHATMQGIAASLTDQEMADLAAYYAGPGAK
jgi:cytochrome c553